MSMKRLASLLIVPLVVVAACGQGTGAISRPPSSAGSSATVVPSITPPTNATSAPQTAISPAPSAAAACARSQVDLVAQWIPDPGATVILVRRTDSGQPCLVNVYPPAHIVDRVGVTLDESRHDPPPQPWPIVDEFVLDFSWGIVRPPPTLARPLTASIAILGVDAQVEVLLPDQFQPVCGFTAAGIQVAPAFDMNGEGGEGGSGG